MSTNLINQLPEISRARGYRLYSSSRKRFLDFYQDGGAALMGYRVPGMVLSMKQVLDKGLFLPCCSRYDLRIRNAVADLAGENVNFALFSSRDRIYKMLNINAPEDSFYSADTENKDITFWRPFSGADIKEVLNNFKYVIPVLPFPGSFSPQLLLTLGDTLPENDGVSPVLLSPLIMVIYRLIEYMKTASYSLWVKDSNVIDRLWNRTGPYLYPRYKRENHEKVFNFLLKKGFLISPCYETPSILPAQISEGEKAVFLDSVISLSGGIEA